MFGRGNTWALVTAVWRFVSSRGCGAGVIASGLLTFGLGVSFGWMSPANATCSSSGTDVYACTGDFANGLIIQSDVPSSTSTINVNSLTASPTFITWEPTSTNDVYDTLIVSTGSYKVGNSQTSLSAVNMNISSASSAGSVLQLEINGTFYTAGATSTAVGINNSVQSGGNGGSSTTNDGGAGSIGGNGGGAYLITQGSITASGSGSLALYLSANGGNGGNGGSSTFAAGGNGGNGGSSGSSLSKAGGSGITVSGLGTDAPAVLMSMSAGNGGNGASGDTEGGRGGAGGNAGGAADLSSAAIQFDTTQLGNNIGTWTVTTSGAGGIGIELLTSGGNGGNGGSSALGNGGGAGTGGDGGDITVYSGQRNITTSGSQAPAMVVESIAGQGGTGGAGKSFGDGGSGGAGGEGGNITISGNTVTQTSGTQSPGLVAYSLGGAGGDGGDGGFFDGSGSGGTSGPGGTIKVTIDSTDSSILTTGGDSPGVILQSVGGYAGSSGSATGLVGFSSSGGSAGAGGTVSLNNGAAVTTTGDQSPTIMAQSVGGGGGNGGSAFGVFYSTSSGDKAIGGAGGTVTVTNSAALTASGNDAAGIQAESIGGTGGNGGAADSVIDTFGGGAANGAAGGAVTVANTGTIITGLTISGGPADGPDPVCGTGCSAGISAQSIGGGGGNAGSTGAWFSVGGAGGGGGGGGVISVTNTGANITTSLAESEGILAQSIGGGGGEGSSTLSVGVSVSVTLGGSGGDGGNGANVTVLSNDGSQLSTAGDDSPGIHAQSIGGGGGNATYSEAIAVSAEIPAIAIAIGGAGGSGGNAGSVLVNTVDSSYTGSSLNKITTAGINSPGIFGQSVGGGGGNGGFTLSYTGSGGEGSAGIAISLGGSAGSGGAGGSIEVMSNAQVQTAGDLSAGLAAQSVGGGGGTGGTALSGDVAAGSAAIAFSLGGVGGDGGDSGSVQVITQSPGSISTTGTQSPGISAQSIGGGGGAGGLSISGTLTLAADAKSLTLSIGGSGGEGGASVTGTTQAAVLVDSAAPITTAGSNSQAILAQSIGGGGGNGGTSIAGSLNTTSAVELYLAIGGTGGSGGSGGNVNITSAGALATAGALSEGILAQSIGGGGGIGGLSVNLEANIGDTLTVAAAIGGSGGSGGTANTVDVTNTGSILTSGAGSDAILAQSIGGGGGRGGETNTITIFVPSESETEIPAMGLQLTVGGSGGSGQTGNTVTLSNTGAIMATGLGSDGIVGQSIGGGGGKGSTNVNPDYSFPDGTPEVDFYQLSIGGSGGTGANAAAVTLTSNSGAITTGSGHPTLDLGSTNHGYGIFLQSVGGGGGDGAIANGSPLEIDAGISITFSVGGSAGEAGNGGTVTAANSGTIVTENYTSNGIFAQSVGGGGGVGASGIIGALTSGSTKGLTLGVGGAGGNGGAVTVTNSSSGKIVTEGDNSIGIYAQSIGGGGGDGTTAISGDVSVTSSPVSPDLEADIGGATGAGGTGGTVTVTNAATIMTGVDASALGAEMDGILAQSIGGGGGGASLSVGSDISNNYIDAQAFTVILGGTGGSGGAAGQVSVTNSGNVATLGDISIGVFAQSVGGGGGNGLAQVGGTVTGGSGNTVALTLGNAGGSGGDGGAVALSNSGTVTTGSTATATDLTISNAHGLFAQSVGNGGGTAETAGALLFAGGGNGIGMTLGGSSGSGAGGAVTLNNIGTVVTYNYSSYGLFGQSVGGGGGASSDLGGMGSQSTWSASVSLGGSGGSGNGGAVTITNGSSDGSGGEVNTHRDGSVAIFGQSIGGGGGDGGDATSAGLSTNESIESTANATLALAVGGSNSSSGNGGAVTIDLFSGAVTTGGTDSSAIFAQSIGGGGGRAGDGSVAETGTLRVSGIGNATGNGGAVTVNATGGSIAFTGANAYGIFAQSVGGGGGLAGNVLMGPSTNFGSGLTMGGDGTASGNGGVVLVTLGSSVKLTTSGDSSVGILAQSVGGGGGVMGQVGATATGALIGSAGGIGTAGAVQVTVDGKITTSGDSAHGVFAQAAGGESGSSSTGNVMVTVNGSIAVSGAGANGIYAQSSGSGMGTVGVIIASGATVQGGAPAVQSGEFDGAGVFINQGTSSTIDNAGTISSVSGSSGVAIRSVDTTLTITNAGTISGQVIDGTGTTSGQAIGGTASTGKAQITLNNSASGTLNVGSLIEANVNNAGLLMIDGASTSKQALITGNFTQSSGGLLVINADFSKGAADLLSVGGTASLAGYVEVRSLSTLLGTSVTVLSADGGLSQQGIALAPTPLVSYGLSRTGNDLVISVTSGNFTPSSIALSPAERAVAHGLQSIWNAGGTPSFGALFALLNSDAGVKGANYATDLNRLSPGAELALGARQPAETQNFSNGLLSRCPEFSGSMALVTQDGCAWMRVIGRNTDQRVSNGIPSFNINNFTYQIGGQTRIASDWFFTGSLAYQNTNLNDGKAINGSGNSGYGGVALKWQPGPLMVAFALSGSYGQFSTTRTISLFDFSGIGTASPTIESADARIRAAYDFVLNKWYVRPYLDLDLINTHSPSFSESGLTTVGLNVATANQMAVAATPSVEIGTRIDLSDGIVMRPFVMAGVSIFSNSTWNAQTGFDGAPAGSSRFTTSVPEGSAIGRFGGGLQLLGQDNIDLRLEYDGEYGSYRVSNAGLLTAAYHF